MQTIHAILAIQQRLYRDLVGRFLFDEHDALVVPVEDTELAIASAIRRLLDQEEFSVDDPVLVVTASGDANDIPASFSRLLIEFPEVTIIDISTKSIRSFQLRIKKRKFNCSKKGLLSAIRECRRDLLE